MAAIEGAFSIVSSSYTPSSSPKTLPSLMLQISTNYPSLSLKSLTCPLPSISSRNPKTSHILRCSTVEEQVAVAVETEQEEIAKTPKPNQRRKLFVLNLPWSLTVSDIKELFGQCGTVSAVEIIKTKDGKNRGFAFVTMASGEEAEAVVKKFDSYELSGRIIRVEYAKRFKKPPGTPPPPPPRRDSRYKLYVSNLAWKARSNHLRELFSGSSNPISARVVFENASGRSTGYGFVSYGTKEEAEAAISSFDGKELLGRPIRLKFSEQNDNEGTEEISDEQPLKFSEQNDNEGTEETSEEQPEEP